MDCLGTLDGQRSSEREGTSSLSTGVGATGEGGKGILSREGVKTAVSGLRILDGATEVTLESSPELLGSKGVSKVGVRDFSP